MDEFKRWKTYERKVKITGAYTDSLANDYALLSQHLGLPSKILWGWKRRSPAGGAPTGWLSFPVTREDYRVLLIIVNFLWGQEELIRMQMAHKSQARREHVLRGTGLSWIERTVLEDLLRRKCLGERRYIQWDWYRKWLHGRYPEGYQQLTFEILARMKKKACDTIRYARNSGTFEVLVKSLGLEIINGLVSNPRVKQLTESYEQSEVTCHPNSLAPFSIGGEGSEYTNDVGIGNEVEDVLEMGTNPGAPQISFEEWACQFAGNDIIARADLYEKIVNMYGHTEETEDNPKK